MKKVLSSLLFLLFAGNLMSQELRCNISVNYSQVQGTNIQVFQDMQKALYEFMNNTKWTEHVYTADERIETSFMINISQQIGTERFIATLTVQSSRPIFNAIINTTLLNYQEKKEDFHFEFIQQRPLEFNINTYQSLSSTLAFYTYIILGLDYDSFSKNGGNPYFQKAQQIVNLGQSSPDPGWKAYESTKNRYWLSENLTNPTYSNLHDFLYQYHRMGLDQLHEKLEDGRAEIALSLEHLRKVYRKKPDIFILPLIINAKSDEIIKVFSESFPREQAEVVNILREIDPANSSKYQGIQSSN